MKVYLSEINTFHNSCTIELKGIPTQLLILETQSLQKSKEKWFNALINLCFILSFDKVHNHVILGV